MHGGSLLNENLFKTEIQMDTKKNVEFDKMETQYPKSIEHRKSVLRWKFRIVSDYINKTIMKRYHIHNLILLKS